MLELAVGAQIVAAGVGGTAQGALEAAGEVDMIVVAYVRHDLAAQLAAMQVAATGETLKGEPHVPGLRAYVRRITEFVSIRFVFYL